MHTYTLAMLNPKTCPTPPPRGPPQVWPLLVDYFYQDSITVSEGNVLALLALSRQLLVSSVDEYCQDFIREHLDTSNCISYLHKAVKYNISDIQQQCIALAAQGALGRWRSTVAQYCGLVVACCRSGGRSVTRVI